MQPQNEFDVAIIGGGLAGLATAIQLGKQGYAVALFEKEAYPFHKVCGEYVSLESRNFLCSLGLPLDTMNLPFIDTLFLTSPGGKVFTTPLPLGGFGISRFLLDSSLADLAVNNGVQLFQKTKVENVQRSDGFIISFAGRTIKAKTCCAAYGKRSNLDIKWNRQFLQQQHHRLNNYVGVKYHIKSHWTENVIGLHNFKNGYCGISRIEENKYCLCYMTKAENLKRSNNNIGEMEQQILFQNPHLRRLFLQSEIIQEFPVTISQISFSSKTKVENGILMLGDAAGMITPLCGNGMSIALHTAKIAANLIHDFLQGKLSQSDLESAYALQWKKNFSARLRTGRMIQTFFGSNSLSHLFIRSFQLFPILARPVIRLTHGKPF